MEKFFEDVLSFFVEERGEEHVGGKNISPTGIVFEDDVEPFVKKGMACIMGEGVNVAPENKLNKLAVRIKVEDLLVGDPHEGLFPQVFIFFPPAPNLVNTVKDNYLLGKPFLFFPAQPEKIKIVAPGGKPSQDRTQHFRGKKKPRIKDGGVQGSEKNGQACL